MTRTFGRKMTTWQRRRTFPGCSGGFTPRLLEPWHVLGLAGPVGPTRLVGQVHASETAQQGFSLACCRSRVAPATTTTHQHNQQQQQQHHHHHHLYSWQIGGQRNLGRPKSPLCTYSCPPFSAGLAARASFQAASAPADGTLCFSALSRSDLLQHLQSQGTARRACQRGKFQASLQPAAAIRIELFWLVYPVLIIARSPPARWFWWGRVGAGGVSVAGELLQRNPGRWHRGCPDSEAA